MLDFMICIFGSTNFTCSEDWDVTLTPRYRNSSSSVKFFKAANRSESLSWHLNLFLFSLGPKLYYRQPFSSTHCSRQEPSESTSISLITFPLSLLPLISLAKLRALKFSFIILVTPFAEVNITKASNHWRYMSCSENLLWWRKVKVITGGIQLCRLVSIIYNRYEVVWFSIVVKPK